MKKNYGLACNSGRNWKFAKNTEFPKRSGGPGSVTQPSARHPCKGGSRTGDRNRQRPPPHTCATPPLSRTQAANYVLTLFLSPFYPGNWLQGFQKCGHGQVLISGKAGNRNSAVQLKALLLAAALESVSAFPDVPTPEPA